MIYKYYEPCTVSRRDNKTLICSSCGIREAVQGVLKEEDVEELVRRNREMYRDLNGTWSRKKSSQQLRKPN